MTPEEFMVFIYGIPMGEVDKKDLGKLANMLPNEIDEILDGLEKKGFYINGQMESKYIGVVEMRGEKTTRMKSTKKTPESYKECLDMWDKVFNMNMSLNGHPGMVKIDWGDPVQRQSLINVILKIEKKYFDMSESITGKGVKAPVSSVKGLLAEILEFTAKDDFWSDKLMPHNVVKNINQLILSAINAKRKKKKNKNSST